MFNSKSLRVLYFIFLFSLGSKNIFAGLLPETVIEVGPDKYKMVKDFSRGDDVVSLAEAKDKLYKSEVCSLRLNKKSSNKAILLELRSSDGKSGLLMVGENQKFYRFGALHRLKPKLLNKIKKGNEKLLRILLNVIWIDAKYLRVGDKIRGSQNNSLLVTKVEHVKFNKKMDFYELSLKDHHTFYLIDSAGHYVLTHNIGFLAIVGISTLIGAALGGTYAAWKSHKKGILCKEAILKGVLIGASVGFVTSILVYGSVSLYLSYFSNQSSFLVSYLTKHSTSRSFIGVSRDIIPEIYSNIQVFPKETIEFLEKLKHAFTIINKTVEGCCIAGPIVGGAGYAGDCYLDVVLDDIYVAENMDMDFSGIDKGD